MEQTIAAVIAWLAPILSAIIVTAATTSINAKVAEGQRTADERHAETEAKRKTEAEWRGEVDRRMEEQGAALRSVADDREDWYAWRAQMVEHLQSQDERISSVLQAQCTQMRSDIIHKCHRYLDDLGRASTEEKAALHAEHQEYAAMCEANDIINSFVDTLVERVMQLPEREI